MNSNRGNVFLSVASLCLMTIVGLLLLPVGQMAIGSNPTAKIKYRTRFGNCPSRVAGSLAFKLIKTFEKNRSLKDVKRQIIDEDLQKEHFLARYKIDYGPEKDLVSFEFVCPRPLMKVQVYQQAEESSYEAILVENGKLYDPTYEELLRREKKIDFDLPYLALPLDKMGSKEQELIAKIINNQSEEFRKYFSEIILNEENELTIIMSIKGHPSSVFIGVDEWESKMLKLTKIVNYLKGKNKIPSVVNLTNSKKVVVKFSNKI